MRNIYFKPVLLIAVFAISCSKDAFRKYDDRIVGVWRITDVDRLGLFGGSLDNLRFRDGEFTFYDGGRLDYRNPGGSFYTGNWDITRKFIGEEQLRGLLLTVANPTTAEVISAYYDDMNFSGTNHFKARSVDRGHTYMTHFRR